MKKYVFLAFGLLLVAALIGAAQGDNSRTLRVTVHYTGSGTVDDNHPVAVALWDSPSFMEQGANAMPLEVKVTKSNNGAVTFSNVSTSPVYVSTAYDPSGKWDGMSGPPPTGSSLGMYSKEPGKPEPVRIQPGKTVSIDVSFDDTLKMP